MRGQPKRYTDHITGMEMAQVESPYLLEIMVRRTMDRLRYLTGADIIKVDKRIDTDCLTFQAIYDSRKWTGLRR